MTSILLLGFFCVVLPQNLLSLQRAGDTFPAISVCCKKMKNCS